MLRINRQPDCAVRVILALSKKAKNKRVPTSEVGHEMLIPPSLLQRIVADLANGRKPTPLKGKLGDLNQRGVEESRVCTLAEIIARFEAALGPVPVIRTMP